MNGVPVRLVRHRGRRADGRPCRHLLFKVTDGCLQLQCECGGVVELSTVQLMTLAMFLQTRDFAGWELLLGEGVEVEE